MTSVNKPHEIQNLSELNRIIDHENTFVLMYYGSYFKNMKNESDLLTSYQRDYKKILKMMSTYNDFVFILVELEKNWEINSIYTVRSPAEFFIFERGMQTVRERASKHALLDIENHLLWAINPPILRKGI